MATGEKLSRREREIMDVLFALGDSASAEQIRERLSEAPGYSAVRAMLAKLERKGVVRHEAVGLRYVYRPTVPRSVARRRAVGNLLKVFFGGSPGLAVTSLLRSEKWSDTELDELAREIGQVREGRRKQ